MYYIDSHLETVTHDDKGIIFKYHDGSELKYTEDYIQFTNKYGDVEIINLNGLQYYRAYRPTYDELYEHWLKTK